ncbi:MAG: hypothetical protein AAF587_44645 [Bacteroidota bacterium]
MNTICLSVCLSVCFFDAVNRDGQLAGCEFRHRWPKGQGVLPSGGRLGRGADQGALGQVAGRFSGTIHEVRMMRGWCGV